MERLSIDDARRQFDLDIDRELVRAEVAAGLFGTAHRKVQRGRFELIRRRGEGSFGIVYEALDTERGDRVALKLLSRLNARAIAQLKHEFRALSALHHPNLVRLDTLFNQNDDWFFSMELVHGEPFDAFVQAERGGHIPRLRAALAQLVAAVSAIHAAGKLHRDLKPSNVLVTAEGRLVVLDFGLAFDEPLGPDAVRTQSEIAGTPGYMAPELVHGRAPTRASDWYAVGVMLFEALTGKLPFQGGMLQVLTEKLRREAPDPRSLAPDAPPELCALCSQLLRRAARQRADGDQILRVLGAQGSDATPASRPTRASSAKFFVGREQELAALEQQLQQLPQAAPAAVLLHGTSGVGKSALLEQFARRSAGRALVLRGRCHCQESVPYKVFDGVMDALAMHLRRLSPSRAASLLPRHLRPLLRLFPALGRVASVADSLGKEGALPSDARELRNQGFAALKELLLRLTDQGPVVIAVDDLQWGDIDSAHMLASVLGAPDRPPLLFVGAYRSDEADSSAFLRAILAHDGPLDLAPLHIELPSLPPPIARELAGRLLPESAPALREAIADEAQGVPFFITELAGYVDDDRQLGTGIGLREGLCLEQLILTRVAALPRPAQRLLQVLSVAGSPLELVVASDAAALGDAQRDSLLALRAKRLLRLRHAQDGELVETYHDRIRETISASMSAPDRCATHQALADALQHHHIADPERLVLHYQGAGDRVRAGETAVQAGLAAGRKLAFNHAVQLLQRAVELLPLPGRKPHELYRALGDALSNAGQNVAAGDAYLQAAAQAPTDEQSQLRALAAARYIGTLQAQKGLRLVREVLRGIDVQLPQSELGTLREYHLQSLMLRARRIAGAPRRCAQPPSQDALRRLDVLRAFASVMGWVDVRNSGLVHLRYVREAIGAGDPVHLLHALTSEVLMWAMAGGATGERNCRRRLAELGAVAAAVDTPFAQAMLHLAEANRLLLSGRAYASALSHADRCERLLAGESAALPGQRIRLAMAQMLALSFKGGLRRLATLAGTHERDARERDDHFVPMMLLSCGSVCQLADDRPRDALEMLTKMRPGLELSLNFRFTWWMRSSEVMSYHGRSAQGFEQAESYWPDLRNSDLFWSNYARYTGIYYRARGALAAHLETGEPRYAELARQMAARLPDEDSSHGAFRAALQAALFESEGDRARGIQLMRLSRDRFRACQAELSALAVERCVHKFTGDRVELDRVDAQLQREGVVNPERWAWTFFPTRTR